MTPKLQIIGLSGKAGSGKDYIAQNILKPFGYQTFSLAWHFKVWAVGKQQATHDEVFHTKPPAIRKMLQEEGTERGRNLYGENVWCNTMAEWFNVMAEYNGLNTWVCPDIRFPNEVEFVHSLGGKVYRIMAPKRVAKSSLTEDARKHISETALDNYVGFDGIIYNDPEYSELVQKQVCDLLEVPYSHDTESSEVTGWWDDVKQFFKY